MNTKKHLRKEMIVSIHDKKIHRYLLMGEMILLLPITVIILFGGGLLVLEDDAQIVNVIAVFISYGAIFSIWVMLTKIVFSPNLKQIKINKHLYSMAGIGGVLAITAIMITLNLFYLPLNGFDPGLSDTARNIFRLFFCLSFGAPFLVPYGHISFIKYKNASHSANSMANR